ncbi:hypothetical protein AWB71_05328 [Caballeronia peredens]|nr:hypothetical protein AWB71_05328 [Caballeronia peredens]
MEQTTRKTSKYMWAIIPPFTGFYIFFYALLLLTKHRETLLSLRNQQLFCFALILNAVLWFCFPPDASLDYRVINYGTWFLNTEIHALIDAVANIKTHIAIK